MPAFGRIVAMMQFNMYHHYTVDEHLLRCIGMLAEIEAGRAEDAKFASELMRTIQPRHRELLYVALFLHDIAKGRIEDHSIAGARVARNLCPRLGFLAGGDRNRRLADRGPSRHVVGRPVARPVRPHDDRALRRRGAVGRAHEAAHHPDHRRHQGGRARGVERLEGAAHPLALLRDRAGAHRRIFRGQPRPAGGRWRRPSSGPISRTGRAAELDAYIALHYPAYWLKVDLPHKIAHARFLQAAARDGKSLATTVSFHPARGVTELTVLAPDHPWLLSIIAGACAVAGANIVDAQIFTTTDGRALDTIAVSREFERRRRRGAPRRRGSPIRSRKRCAGTCGCRKWLPNAPSAKARLKAFAVEPEVTINNGWSNRYTMVEVTGLDRPGLLFELTATLSKLNLNIASAHVATFGERVVDVFYVTDLFGAKITSATRQATIKRALIALLSPTRRGRRPRPPRVAARSEPLVTAP